MKLLYLLLACNMGAFASDKAHSPKLRQTTQSSVHAASAAPQVSPMSRTAKGQALGGNKTKGSCKDNCIGGTAGVCFATFVCCCYQLCANK
jgi:hypothetical protein